MNGCLLLLAAFIVIIEGCGSDPMFSMLACSGQRNINLLYDGLYSSTVNQLIYLLSNLVENEACYRGIRTKKRISKRDFLKINFTTVSNQIKGSREKVRNAGCAFPYLQAHIYMKRELSWPSNYRVKECKATLEFHGQISSCKVSRFIIKTSQNLCKTTKAFKR